MTGASLAPRRRDEALAFIIDRLVKTGTAPSYIEIGRELRVGKSRARQLVQQLIADGDVEKVPGAMRALRVRDVTHAREIVAQTMRRLGWPVAMPLGPLEQPCPQVQLPRLSPFGQLPEAE